MKKITILFFIGLYTLMTLSSPGLIYCQGADGHVAIETPHQKSHCSHDHKESHENQHNDKKTFKDLNPCQPCVDIPLETTEQVRNKETPQTSFSFLTAVPPNESIRENVNSQKRIYFPIPPPRLNSTLTFLRTVILLV